MTSIGPSPVIDTIPIGSDGFYHPTSEEQIVALVKKAYAEGLQVRCRGASHSIAWAIYTDPGPGDKPVPNKVSEQRPPQGPNINIMLDQYYKLEWLDEQNGVVEAEAGMHLGYDPEDPTHTSTLDNSLLYQAFKKGWALEDLGGITHQTVGGFISSGSSGGTLIYRFEENLLAFRVIDGGIHRLVRQIVQKRSRIVRVQDFGCTRSRRRFSPIKHYCAQETEVGGGQRTPIH